MHSANTYKTFCRAPYIPNMHQGFKNFFRYKPVIIFEIGAYWTTWALLLWANGVAWMKFMQFTFGLASATEVAYYTYMYAQVNYASFLRLFNG